MDNIRGFGLYIFAYMKKAIFFTSFLLVITLVMLFDLKNNKTEKVSGKQNSIIALKKISPASDLNESYLKVSFLDIGQGDASFIEWPNGEQMLVDCGLDANILSALGRVMKYYDREIDYLVITHPDLDHYGGCIDVLKRFAVKNIIYTGLQKEDKSWQYFWDMIKKENAHYSEIAAQDIWQIGDAKINFLYPDKPVGEINMKKDNNASIVFKLSYVETHLPLFYFFPLYSLETSSAYDNRLFLCPLAWKNDFSY